MYSKCKKCCAGSLIVVGLLLLLNAFVWPLWLDVDGWVAWGAVLLVLFGLLTFVMPTCPHCAKGMCGDWSEPAMKKRQ